MDTELINKVTSEYKKVKHPDFHVGDVIDVHTKIKEEDKERIQIFTGVVIAIKGAGISKTFTVRKISYGVGVEKTYPLYSPVIAKIKIIKQAKKVRRSKLYYLRKRVGKAALKVGLQIPVEGDDLETKFESSFTAASSTDKTTEDKEKGSEEEESTEDKNKDKKKEESKENVDEKRDNEENKENSKKIKTKK